jgi:hypothetical protein
MNHPVIVFQGHYRIRRCCTLCKRWELCCEGYPILRRESFAELRDEAVSLQRIGVLT